MLLPGRSSVASLAGSDCWWDCSSGSSLGRRSYRATGCSDGPVQLLHEVVDRCGLGGLWGVALYGGIDLHPDHAKLLRGVAEACRLRHLQHVLHPRRCWTRVSHVDPEISGLLQLHCARGCVRFETSLETVNHPSGWFTSTLETEIRPVSSFGVDEDEHVTARHLLPTARDHR